MKQFAIPFLAVLLACACGCTPTQRGAVAGGAIGAAGGAAVDRTDFFADNAAANVSAAIDRIVEGKEP